MFPFAIRPFHQKDRLSVFQIAADTAFFGESVEHFFEDRSLFCQAFCVYYTDYESNHVWVAESEQKVVGYIFGCSDTQRMKSIVLRKILPALLVRVVRGNYYFGKQSRLYLWSLM